MAAAGTIINEGIVSVQTLGSLGYSPMDQQLTDCFLPNAYNNICNDDDNDEFIISDDCDDIKSFFAGFHILDHLDPHCLISDDFDPGVFDMDATQYLDDENPLPGGDILIPDLFESAAAAAAAALATPPFEYHHHHHHHHHNHPSYASLPPLSMSPSGDVYDAGGFLVEGEEESRSSSSSRELFTNIPVFVESGSVSEDEHAEDASRQSRSSSRHGTSKFNNWEPSNNDKYGVPRTVTESTITAPRRVRRRKDQLWYFLLEILGDPEYNPNYIQWENKDQGIFRFIESKKVAQLWGAKKKRSGMTYEYFARAMRHYYSRGIMRRVTGRRLVYQFGPKAENWKGYAQQVTITTRSNQDDAGC